jgi:hypothetical protein
VLTDRHVTGIEMHPSGQMHSEIVATIDARSAAIGAEHCASGITRSIFLGRSPDTAKAEDVRRFRLHLASSRSATRALRRPRS